MNQESISKRSRHIQNVSRIEASLAGLSTEEAQKLFETQKERVETRWAICLKSFKMLFMTLNRGNRFPIDSFDIKVRHDAYEDDKYDTFIRVWRSKDHASFFLKPYVDCGHGIYDHEFEAESFGNEYTHLYGTHRAHTAKLQVSTDNPEPEINLVRIDGKLVDGSDAAFRAIFLAAIEDTVLPALDTTEESLALVFTALLDSDLNRELAQKTRLRR